MHNKHTPKWLGVVTLVLLGALMTSASLAYDVFLAAKPYGQLMPDGRTVPMWGYERYTDATFTTVLEAVKTPGPMITIPVGDTVLNITLKNLLPESTSILIPQLYAALAPVDFTTGPFAGRVHSFTTETAVGATYTYSWTGIRPGAFIYQSGTHPAVQVQMGLIGGVKLDSALNLAYPGVAYTIEQDVFFTEIDPELHQAVSSGTYGTPGSAYQSTIEYKPKYYLINGLQYTQGLPALAGVAGDTVLIRMFNGGLKSHAAAMLNLDFSLVAEDGFPYAYRNGAILTPYSKLQAVAFLNAAKTIDAVATIPNPKVFNYSIFDRMGYPGVAAVLPDLNLDGLVNAVDVFILQGYLAGNIKQGIQPWVAALNAADLNHDGSITSSDMVQLMAYQMP